MTTPIPTDHLPKLVRQLDGSRYAGANCGCVATAVGIAWSTGSRLRPTPSDCRAALGGTWVGQQAKPPTDATSLADQARAWASFKEAAQKKGLRLGAFTRRLMDPWSDVIDTLDAGYGVLLQYSYPVITRRKPVLSGDPNFAGLHIAAILGIRRRNGRLDLLVFDGLYDGRRQGIPSGPQWVPAWVMAEAAAEKVFRTLVDGGMAKDKAKTAAEGRAVFAVISRSKPIAQPKPPAPKPEPLPDPVPVLFSRDALTGLLARTDLGDRLRVQVGQRGADGFFPVTLRVDATDNLAATVAAGYDARIAALELALGTARTALVAAGESIDDAIADIDALLVPATDTGAAPTDGVGRE